MKKYEVTFYYHTNLIVVVDAENEEEALRKAEVEAEKECNIPILLSGLEEDGNPDVEESDEND